MISRFVNEQERGAQQVDIGVWACLFRKKWQPRISFTSTLILFVVLGVIFAGVAVLMFGLNMRVKEFQLKNYDLNSKCSAVLGTN